MEVAGVIDCLLGVHAVVNNVREQLDVALGLHESAHHAKNCPEIPVLGGESGDCGVERPLTGGQDVRVTFHEVEGSAPVLKADAGVTCNYTASETLVEAVNERASVTLSVHRAEVGGVASDCGFG